MTLWAAAAAAAMATAWLLRLLATRANLVEGEVGGCVTAARVPQPVKPPATVGHNMQEKKNENNHSRKLSIN